MARPSPAFLVCLLLAADAAAQDGRLSRVRAEVHDSKPAAPASTPSSDASAPNKKDEDESPLSWFFSALTTNDESCEFTQNAAGTLIYGPIALALASPFLVPDFLMGDNWDKDYYFPPYPYRKHYPGYCTIHPNRGEEIAEYWGPTRLTSISTQVTLEDGNDFRGVNRLGGVFVLDTTCRLGIVAHWDWFNERLACGRHDNLAIGDVNATVTFARTHWGEMRTGLGFRWLADGDRGDFGVNFHYGGDFFPVRPVIISTSFDWGTIGDASFVRLHGTVGVNYRHLEIFTGYDYMRIGRVELQGPLVGLRFWY
ncbi:MAG: hypothetical protein U0793_31235 [Gemmataceae bacterium]